jgi:FkbM family methyltransferase
MNIYFPDINISLEIPPTNNDFGSFWNTFHSILIDTSIEKEEIVRVKVFYIITPIQIRVYTDDVLVFWQIFINKEYDFPIKLNPQIIIDGGAYTGFSTVFFANKYPKAKIIAIEPEWSNYQLLEKNTSDYCGIELYNTAIWNKNSYLKIKDSRQAKSAFMVEERISDEQGSFRAVTIGDILNNSGFDEIDILKLDIEGAEKEVFSHNYEEWLNKVNILIIELHDRMKEGCSKAFFSAIKKYTFNKTFKGENIVLIKPNIAPRFKLSFVCKFENGTLYDSSVGKEPLIFTLGDGQILPSLEQTIMIMKPGDSKTIYVTSDKGFGQRNEHLVQVISRNELPADLTITVGQQLEIQKVNGTEFVTIIDISESTVTLDANHPLSGKNLIFDIQLLEIN